MRRHTDIFLPGSALKMNVCRFSIFVYLFVKIIARPEGGLRQSAPLGSMDLNVIQEMKKFKLEVLKTKILSEINLPEPPDVEAPVRVPKYMLKLLDKNYDEESVSEESEELIMYPINDDLTCLDTNETSCSRFEFQSEIHNRTISSIHIWLHKLMRNMPLLVGVGFCTPSEDDGEGCKTEEVLSEIEMDFGWSAFKVPERLMMLSQRESGTFSVEAFGSNFETNGDFKPFLVAHMNSATAERRRRSTRTTSNKVCAKQCCKIDFYISFKEIGWRFVVAPAGFHANMCYGKCSNDQINAFPSHYHRTMNLALTNRTTVLEKQEPAWTPCCSPTNLKPLSMIYKAANDTQSNTTHELVHHEIPDMIAESCGCW